MKLFLAKQAKTGTGRYYEDGSDRKLLQESRINMIFAYICEYQ